MRVHIRRRIPSPSMAVALVALTVSMTGTAFGDPPWLTRDDRPGGELDGTYGTPTIRDGVVKTEDFAAGATAPNADRLDGRDATDFLGVGEKAADSDLLDGRDSTAFAAAGDSYTKAEADERYAFRNYAGVVDRDGSSSASSFTSSRTDVGEYLIRFDIGSFPTKPILVATALVPGRNAAIGPSAWNLSSGSAHFTVHITDATGSPVDGVFHFIAQGGR